MQRNKILPASVYTVLNTMPVASCQEQSYVIIMSVCSKADNAPAIPHVFPGRQPRSLGSYLLHDPPRSLYAPRFTRLKLKLANRLIAVYINLASGSGSNLSVCSEACR